MRIDGTQGVGHQGSPEPRPASASKGGPLVEAGISTPSAEVASSQASYVRQALQVDEVDAQAVEHARQLLESGELFSLDAIRRAAQALLDEGP